LPKNNIKTAGLAIHLKITKFQTVSLNQRADSCKYWNE